MGGEGKERVVDCSRQGLGKKRNFENSTPPGSSTGGRGYKERMRQWLLLVPFVTDNCIQIQFLGDNNCASES